MNLKKEKWHFWIAAIIKSQEKPQKNEVLEHLKYFESGLLYFIKSIIVSESSTEEGAMRKKLLGVRQVNYELIMN